VPRVGIEPTLLAETDFESVASTYSATEAITLVVGKGYDPFRCSPSDHSPRFIRPGRTPVLPTVLNFLAERQGVEPCERITTLYGLAIRCLTIRPTLQKYFGGNGEIRTHGSISGSTVFKTVAINRTLPRFHTKIHTICYVCTFV
jgi:hypothetical protein